MLQVPESALPCISITYAPRELQPIDTESPFTLTIPDTPGSPKPQLLSPPPVLSPQQLLHVERRGQRSPLSFPASGKGVDPSKFEAMLRNSRERNTTVAVKKPVELRKELALKVQIAKQLQRRARFLTKLAEPPSPTATEVPVTPPESPAIFHFSLPSPGLESPIEVFENLLGDPGYTPIQMRIEQVDFRLPSQKLAEQARISRQVAQEERVARSLPSLEQISQKLGKSSVFTMQDPPPPESVSTRTNRLPSFLQSRLVTTHAEVPDGSIAVTKPLRVALGTSISSQKKKTPALPPSPRSPVPPKLQITTTICPPTKSKASPTDFTEANITQFSCTQSVASAKRVNAKSNITSVAMHAAPVHRAEVARDMLGKLSRRRPPHLSRAASRNIRPKDDLALRSPIPDEKHKRRTSAPAELTVAHRNLHPILNRPGAF